MKRLCPRKRLESYYNLKGMFKRPVDHSQALLDLLSNRPFQSRMLFSRSKHFVRNVQRRQYRHLE